MKKLLAALILIPVLAVAAINQFAPGLLFSTIMSATRAAAGMQSREIVVDGHRYRYLDNQREGKPTILFIHGFAADKDNWTRMALFLRKDYRLVAIDLLGHGESDQPMQPVSYRISAQVERLHRVVQAIGLGKLHLVGNSMGGHIAGFYAARYPEQTASVSFLNNGGIISPVATEAWQAIARGEPNPLVIRQPEDAERFFAHVMAAPPFMTGAIKRYFAEQSMARQALNDYIFTFMQGEHFENLATELPKISAPAQIIWGEDDRLLHVSSVAVMEPLLQHSKVLILPETGHAPMLERPKAVARALDAFIRQPPD